MKKISKKFWIGIGAVAITLIVAGLAYFVFPDNFGYKATTQTSLTPVVMSADKTTVKVGDTTHYTIKVTNNLTKVGTVRGWLDTSFPTGTQKISNMVAVLNLKVGETRQFKYDVKMIDYKATPSYPAAFFIPMCPMGAYCMPGNDVNRLKIMMTK